MKILLKYQNSEYDCGPTSFINALAYLYEREEVPIELIKAIYEYTLDVKNSEGIVGKGGTSREKQIELGKYFNKYASETNFKIHAESTKDVTEEILKETINKGGVIVARCFQDIEHYVLITNIIDDMVYIFDPYYELTDEYKGDNEIKVILDNPYEYNRIITLNRLFAGTDLNYSLMEPNKRCITLITKE